MGKITDTTIQSGGSVQKVHRGGETIATFQEGRLRLEFSYSGSKEKEVWELSPIANFVRRVELVEEKE